MHAPLDGAALDLCEDPYCDPCNRAIARAGAAALEAEAEAEDYDARIGLTPAAEAIDDADS